MSKEEKNYLKSNPSKPAYEIDIFMSNLREASAVAREERKRSLRLFPVENPVEKSSNRGRINIEVEENSDHARISKKSQDITTYKKILISEDKAKVKDREKLEKKSVEGQIREIESAIKDGTIPELRGYGYIEELRKKL